MVAALTPLPWQGRGRGLGPIRPYTENYPYQGLGRGRGQGYSKLWLIRNLG